MSAGGSDKESELVDQLGQTPPHGLKYAIGPESPIELNDVLWSGGVVVGVAIMILAATKVWDWFQNRRRMKADLPAKPLSKWELLLTEINAIEAPTSDAGSSASTNSSHWTPFASAISLNFRRALEMKTGHPFSERTTEEIFLILARSHLNLVTLADSELKQVLLRLDDVRFGGSSMSGEEASDLLALLRRTAKRFSDEESLGIPSSLANHSKVSQVVSGGRVYE